MSVTLDVSKLIGWLKSLVCWRGLQAGHTVRGELCAEAASDRAVCTAQTRRVRMGERANVQTEAGGRHRENTA